MVGLTDISPDVLDLILRSNRISHQALTLYLTGSRPLQYQLLRGLSEIVLSNVHRLVLPRLPQLVPSFRSLRSLTITRGSYRPRLTFLDHPYVLEAVLSLRETLEELTFGFANCDKLFSSIVRSHASSISSEPTANDDNKAQESESTPKAVFPRLQSLKLTSVSAEVNFSLVAPSLTNLDTFVHYVWDHDVVIFLKHLPKTLVRLTVGADAVKSTHNEVFSVMPPHLEQLMFAAPLTPQEEWHKVYDALSKLPKNIQSVNMPWSFNLTKGFCAALPRSLTTLPGLRFVEQDLREAIANLPRTLTSMTMLKAPLNVYKHLPPNLKVMSFITLKATNNGEIDEDFAFPSGLTHLSGDFDAALPSKIWSLFPRNLTTLMLFEQSKKLSREAISLLPRTLLFLSAEFEVIWDEQRIPFDWPRLEILHIKNPVVTYEGSPKTDDLVASAGLLYHGLPNSITNLWVNCGIFPCSALVFLPDRLEHLWLNSIVYDIDWDPSSPMVVAKARHLLELGFKSGHLNDSEKSEFIASTFPSEVTIFDLLPKTLTYLNMPLDCPIQPGLEAFSRLPKFLDSLIFASRYALPPEALRYIPMENLYRLDLYVASMDLEAMRRLPRRMNYGNIVSLSPLPDDSEELARAVPHAHSISIGSKKYNAYVERPFKAWVDLENKRQAAVLSEDVEALKELLRP